MSAVDERVARGAAFLDETRPGWDRHIDLDRLSLRSACDCVLGQLDDEPRHAWQETVEAFGLDFEDSQECDLGFSLPSVTVADADWPAGARGWRELTEAWRALITARREGPPEYQHPDGDPE